MAIRKRPQGLSKTPDTGSTSNDPLGAHSAPAADADGKAEAMTFIRAAASGAESATAEEKRARANGTSLETAEETTRAGKDPLDILLNSESRNIILSHVSIAISLAIVPLPLFDFAAVFGTQLHMIRNLANLHGKAFDERLGRSLLAALLGGAGPLIAGAGFASLFKGVPGLGSLIGGASLAVSAGAITYAIGFTFARHFEQGGDLIDFDISKARQSVRNAYQARRHTK